MSVTSADTSVDPVKLGKLVDSASALSNLTAPPSEENDTQTKFNINLLNFPDFPMDSIHQAAKMLVRRKLQL